MHELVRRGLSNREINDELLRRGLIDRPYTRQNISAFRARHGYPNQREPVPARDELIPWVVAEKDASHRYYKCLLLVTRDRAGLPMRDKDRDRMDKFVHQLFDAGAVVHYDRENGWVAVEPRPGVDNDLIHDPRLDDWGDEIDYDAAE